MHWDYISIEINQGDFLDYPNICIRHHFQNIFLEQIQETSRTKEA